MEARLSRRIALALLRLISRVVPARDREAWLQEWEAELGHQQEIRMRPVLGSFFDAAWLRRQFTRDAESVQDLRHGARMLRRSPAFALTAVLVLALGIGATVGIFSVVDHLLLRPLPYTDAERVVMLWQGAPDNPDIRDVSPANCYDWRDRLRSFAVIACVEPRSFDYEGGAEPVVILAAEVTDGFFRAIGTTMLMGRDFTPEEHLAGRNRVIAISHDLWRQAFGEDPGIIGRQVALDGESYTVVGVLPPTYRPRILQSNNDRGIYFPKVLAEQDRRIRGSGFWNVVARLQPDVSLAQAQSELDNVSRDLAREYPRTDAGLTPRVQPLRDHLAGNLTPALRLLLASVCVLLLIASANVANLLLARASGRTRELAVRAAVGAGRGRLVRQLMAESLLLAAIGSAAGLAVAWITIRAIAALSPRSIPALTSVTIDDRAIGFAMLLTGLVATLVGLVPALQTSRRSLVNAMRGVAAQDDVVSRRHSLRSGIVVAEVALAVLLLAGASLLLRSFGSLLQTDPGFNPDRVVALQVFAWDRNSSPARRAAFFQQILRRMQDDPLVAEAGAVSAMPFIEANINIETPVLADRPLTADTTGASTAFLTYATPGAFPTLGVKIQAGRVFDDGDRMGTRPVAVISAELARQAFAGRNPLGRKVGLRIQGRPGEAEVVGVVSDIRHDGLDRPARSEIFVPHAQHGFGSMTFVVRTTGRPGDAVPALKAHIRAVDPAQAIYRAATADELVWLSLVERRFILAMLGAFALLAATLAAIGIYGVMSVATTQRAREFGVRLALGAEKREILGMVLRQGASMTALGLGIGLIATLALGGVMSRFLYAIKPGDPLTLIATIAALAVVALAACLLPARRATRVDPLVALRSE
jgi:putative ABC transport system permease protein